MKPTSHTSRDPWWRRMPRSWLYALQAANIGILLLMAALYLVYSAKRQSGPLYALIANTPVEAFALRLAPFARGHKQRLERKLTDAPLLPEEEAAVQELAGRMARLRPTHVVVLSSGETIFGRLRQVKPASDDAAATNEILYRLDGREQRRKLAEDNILWRQTMVFGDQPLSPRDYRFLISNAQLDAYHLPPYLFVTGGDFAAVQQRHAVLTMLEEEVRQAFGPLVEQSENGVRQVCLFPDRASYVAATGSMRAAHLVNSLGFFAVADNRLYLFEGQSRPTHSAADRWHVPSAGSYRGLSDQEIAVVRHEGAHQLCSVLGILPRRPDLPFWVEEGFAQYCEQSPFYRESATRIALLRANAREGTLVPWEALLARRSDERNWPTYEEETMAYAQAWLLFHHLCQPAHRLRFLTYLKELGEADVVQDTHVSLNTLLNTLQITAARLERELTDRLREPTPRPAIVGKLPQDG